MFKYFSKNFKDLSDVFITRINQIIIDAFRVGKVSDIITIFLSQIISEQIISQGKRGNTPYLPLVRKRQGGGILNKTGKLIQDIKGIKITKVKKNKEENIRMFIDNKYALFIQTGTKNMPARPLLIITQKDREKLREIVINSFSKKNKKIFG